MFKEKLDKAWALHNSLVCVGLDPDEDKLPAAVTASPQPYFEFLRQIVDATHPYCAAYKPQAAHFSAKGREQELEALIAYIKEHYPEHVVILDAKRGDIGSTAEYYAEEAYQRYGADAVTLNPYLGEEAVQPFLAHKDKGVVILCRTSNPGSNWLQGYGAPPVFERVARAVHTWNTSGQCMLVTGATYPEELGKIRQLVGDMPLLVPGIGAQGGDLEAVLAQGLTKSGKGLLISSSRGIIYASSGDDFAEASGIAARQLHDLINEISSTLS